MSVKLRPAAHGDIMRIYQWRNHPDARKGSFSTKPIGIEEHRAYWAARLADGKAFSFIIVSGGEDAGLVRLGRKGEECEVHILVSHDACGKGVGGAALSEAKRVAADMGIKTLVARIKPENRASIAVFLKNGFRPASGVYLCEL